MSSEYKLMGQYLHQIALGMPSVRNLSFDLDRMVAGYDKSIIEEKHIFIAGLARSGTTILLKTIYDSNEFRSTTYRDMPFVLMPNIWKLISRFFYKDATTKVRAHDDGIVISYDSPEAFEEVFWQNFCAKEYLTKDGLIPHLVDDETISLFRRYVYCVVKSSSNNSPKRYLSKNNNNILRLNSIHESFPNAKILIPFRDPLQHAISLRTQHLRFSKLHESDSFSLKYFNWLGHYEFGLGHRPFLFDQTIDPRERGFKPGDINYWLAIWINAYQHLLDNRKPQFDYICFESLCENPKLTLSEIFTAADLDIGKYNLDLISKLPGHKSIQGVESELLDRAVKVYDEIRSSNK